MNASGQYPAVQNAALGSWERFGIELVLTFIIVFTHCTVSERKLFGNGATMIGFAYAACSIVGVSCGPKYHPVIVMRVYPMNNPVTYSLAF